MLTVDIDMGSFAEYGTATHQPGTDRRSGLKVDDDCRIHHSPRCAHVARLVRLIMVQRAK